MLCILVLGALPQEGQKADGILVTISDLTDGWRKKRGGRRRKETEKNVGGKKSSDESKREK